MVTKSSKFLRNFQRIFLEKFWGISWGKIPENFSRISRNLVSKLWSHKNLSSWGPILGNFWRISEELVTGNDSREIPRKFLKENHHGWRIWGNSSLLLLGYGEVNADSYERDGVLDDSHFRSDAKETPTSLVMSQMTSTPVLKSKGTPLSVVMFQMTPTSVVMFQMTPTSVVMFQMTSSFVVMSQMTPSSLVMSQMTPSSLVMSQITPTSMIQWTPTSPVMSQETTTSVVRAQETPIFVVRSQETPILLVETRWFCEPKDSGDHFALFIAALHPLLIYQVHNRWSYDWKKFQICLTWEILDGNKTNAKS